MRLFRRRSREPEPVQRPRRLTGEGAREITRELGDAELDHLWREADDAALKLMAVTGDVAVGDRMDELAEYQDFRAKALAFRLAAEAEAVAQGIVPDGYFS